MVCGDIPFEVDNQILSNNISFRGINISKECQELIHKCLQFLPKNRPSLEQILRHEWMCEEDDCYDSSTVVADEAEEAEELDNLTDGIDSLGAFDMRGGQTSGGSNGEDHLDEDDDDDSQSDMLFLSDVN